MSSLKKDLNISRRSAYAEGTVTNLRIQWESYLSFIYILDLLICLQTQIFFVYMRSVYGELSNPHSLLGLFKWH